MFQARALPRQMEPTTGTLTTFNTSALPRGQVSTQPGTQPGGGGAGGRRRHRWTDRGLWRHQYAQPGVSTAGGGGYGGASGAGVLQTGLIGAESAFTGRFSRGGLAPGSRPGVNQAGQTLTLANQGGNQAFGSALRHGGRKPSGRPCQLQRIARGRVPAGNGRAGGLPAPPQPPVDLAVAGFSRNCKAHAIGLCSRITANSFKPAGPRREGRRRRTVGRDTGQRRGRCGTNSLRHRANPRRWRERAQASR